MKNSYHRQYILHAGGRKKRRGAGAGRRVAAAVLSVSAFAAMLGGCDPVQIVEGSDTHVSIRYDGVMNGLDRATQLAQRACAAHGKTAHLRKTYHEGLGIGERFAFFDCA